MKLLLSLACVVLCVVPHYAQISLPHPVSQRGSVSQRIGVTDISIDYGRPAVNNRQIWGKLVPYDQVWRAGANENTTFTASTAVQINGKDLPAGRYGLHMIPGTKDWTIIFSRDSHAWGSYFYNKDNDALRISVTPTTASHTEVLTFDVPSVSPSSATFSLRWSTLVVPFDVSVDLGATVTEDLRAQLTGSAGFDPNNYAVAASWLVSNNTNMPLAKKWLDASLKGTPTFATLMLSARIAESEKNVNQAKELRQRAIDVATNAELNAYGYELLQANKPAEALPIFELNAQRHPKDPNVWDSLGEAYAMNKNNTKAKECFTKSLSMDPSPDVRKNSETWLEKLNAK